MFNILNIVTNSSKYLLKKINFIEATLTLLQKLRLFQ